MLQTAESIRCHTDRVLTKVYVASRTGLVSERGNDNTYADFHNA